MEMQSTDAENAAFVVFVVLVTRVILAFDLNLYIPLSAVDENMKRAHVRDAVHQKKASAPLPSRETVLYFQNTASVGVQCFYCVFLRGHAME